MPDKSFTVEFWAKGPAIVQDGRHASTEQGSQNLVSYATELVGQGARKALEFMHLKGPEMFRVENPAGALLPITNVVHSFIVVFCQSQCAPALTSFRETRCLRHASVTQPRCLNMSV